jgi:chromosome segregation and condensation protein ScpB
MKDIVLKTLMAAKKPLRPGEIAELAGMDKNDVEKAISELKKEDKVYSPKRCFYDIKK